MVSVDKKRPRAVFDPLPGEIQAADRYGAAAGRVAKLTRAKQALDKRTVGPGFSGSVTTPRQTIGSAGDRQAAQLLRTPLQAAITQRDQLKTGIDALAQQRRQRDVAAQAHDSLRGLGVDAVFTARPDAPPPGAAAAPSAARPTADVNAESQVGGVTVNPSSATLTRRHAVPFEGVDAGVTSRAQYPQRPTGIPGITRIDGAADGAPIYTNVPGQTETALGRNDGTLGQQPKSTAPATAAALTRPGAQPGGQAITGSRPSAADFARARANDIASGDFRSAAGTTARNLRINAQYGNPDEQRRAEAALGQLSRGTGAIDQQEIGGQIDAAHTAQVGDQAQSLQHQQGRQRLQQIAAQNAGSLERAKVSAAASRKQTPITMEDGTLGLLDPVSNTAKAVLGTDGKPIKAQRPQGKLDQKAYGSLVQTLIPQLLGIDPVSGQIVDSKTNESRAPTQEEMVAATDQANVLAAKVFGLKQGSAESGGAQEGQIYQDKNGNRARYVNGRYVPVTE